MKHTDARDIGAEWLCLQAIRQLKFDRFLRSLCWSEERVKLAIGHLIVRTIYTPSELKSMRIMRDNSGVFKLLVLALCINTDGFIRYSSVLEGDTADPKSLPDMVDKLIATNPSGGGDDQKVLVVIDAGIASQENLDLINRRATTTSACRARHLPTTK